VDERGAIDDVDQEPRRPSCQALVGARPGFGFRSGVKDLLAELDGSLLGLLVDDLSGAPAPAGYATIRERKLRGEPEAGPAGTREAMASADSRAGSRVDICAGWRAQGQPNQRRLAGLPRPFEDSPPVAPSLVGDDEVAWHEMAPLESGVTRRIRRLDLSPQGSVIKADVMFRDCIVDPDGTARVVHEYLVSATIDRVTLAFVAMSADPRALPYPTDCPLAADSAALLVGETVHGLRRRVREISTGPASCTHLNDLYRSMADIAPLALLLGGAPE
jgi:hypothetical protein